MADPQLNLDIDYWYRQGVGGEHDFCPRFSPSLTFKPKDENTEATHGFYLSGSVCSHFRQDDRPALGSLAAGYHFVSRKNLLKPDSASGYATYMRVDAGFFGTFQGRGNGGPWNVGAELIARFAMRLPLGFELGLPGFGVQLPVLGRGDGGEGTAGFFGKGLLGETALVFPILSLGYTIPVTP